MLFRIVDARCDDQVLLDRGSRAHRLLLLLLMPSSLPRFSLIPLDSPPVLNFRGCLRDALDCLCVLLPRVPILIGQVLDEGARFWTLRTALRVAM